MNKVLIFAVLGLCCLECTGRMPAEPPLGSLPFIVYFESRYRGLCVGSLVSRTAVLTAAVCVSDPKEARDTRPINVVCGTNYRHVRRGIRVQVTKVILPRLPNVTGDRGYLLQKSAALLLLKRKVPDALAEVPTRAIDIDFLGEDQLSLQDECIMIGWHFFNHDDEIYPVQKFLIRRKLRLQFLNLVTKQSYCDTLLLKFENALEDLGYMGFFSKSDLRCFRDGMYGAPLVCKSGRVVGMLLAPDAQWKNCTGFSNLVHTLNTRFMANFFECVKQFFEPEVRIDWRKIKHVGTYNEINEEEGVIRDMYDGVITDFDNTSEEDSGY
ncbi:hypothetical protein MSG28_001139 [Choristoneura fumiferana]|uniref:Uncharacterized protein n=1 Tax=Choristoneura fumiferana TaxID=7141 RepID=A0ACC0K4A7_CHOFU|nr:hypothetical protein MSG28_001139 [Choristoneura fumiferana]